jgi:YD repeat-containing protein
VIQTTDALGRVTRFEYDPLNQVTKIIDPLGGETAFTYDGNGNLLTLTDARGKTTTWTYDRTALSPCGARATRVAERVRAGAGPRGHREK